MNMTTAKPPLPPPKGKFGPEWHKIHAQAVHRGDVDPERWADATLRFLERTREISAARHTVKMMTEPLKHTETAHAERKKVALAAACRCRAKTMEGKQCGFKATHGEFCKKHAIKT